MKSSKGTKREAETKGPTGDVQFPQSQERQQEAGRGYKGSDIEIPVQFYTNGNGETCFRETVAGEYKIDRAGNVVRYR